MSATETLDKVKAVSRSELLKTVYFGKEKTEATRKASDEALRSANEAFPLNMRTGSNEEAYKRNIKMTFQESIKKHFQPVELFMTSCRDFYMRGFKEVSTRFDLTDHLYKISSLLQSENARKLKPPSLAGVFNRFPQLEEYCDKNLAEKEWRSHASLNFSVFGPEIESREDLYKLSANSYWKKVLSSKNGLDKPCFPNLKVCISLLLCLPFSNAPAERVFNHLKLSKTDNQNAQEVETTDARLKAKFWQLNLDKKPHELEFPKELIEMSQKVKANLPIQKN